MYSVYVYIYIYISIVFSSGIKYGKSVIFNVRSILGSRSRAKNAAFLLALSQDQRGAVSGETDTNEAPAEGHQSSVLGSPTPLKMWVPQLG